MASLQVKWTGVSGNIPILFFDADIANSEEVKNEYNLSYKILQQGDQKLVRSILSKHGFHEVHNESSYFSLMWTGTQLLVSTLQKFMPNQKINHFPRTSELTRKDKLVRNVQRMQLSSAYAKKRYNFLPQTYLIPSEFQEFERAFRRDKGLWIVKPAGLSRGRGIYLINHSEQVPVSESVIVSQYISNPLLVNGYKFDLRLYVAVTSFDPIAIYFYDEGLARIATVKYDKSQKKIKDLCMHLTNYSINRLSDQYIRCDNPDIDNYGNKWSLKALLRHLATLGHDVKQLISKIEDVIIKTIISGEFSIAQACRAFIPYRGNCFELYGFDILIDENLKPWLLEVNMSPSLTCDAPIDVKIKSQLLIDLFNLIGIVCENPVEARKEHKTKLINHSRYILDLKQGRKFCPSSSFDRKLTNEESKVLLMLQEEEKRRGGFIRIFPAEDTWHLYKNLLEDTSGFNRMVHEQLFGARIWHSRSSHITLPQSTLKILIGNILLLSRNSKSLSSIADPEVTELQPSVESDLSIKSPKNPERSLSCISLDIDDSTSQEKRKEDILQCLKEKNLSVKQARKAFAVYLELLHMRLLNYAKYSSLDQTQQQQISQKTDLIQKFIQRASSNLSVQFKCGQYSTKMPLQQKIDNVAESLKNFIKCYTKETKILFELEENGTNEGVDQVIFESFIATANEEGLQEVLTVSTKLNRSSDFPSTSSNMMFLPRLSFSNKLSKKKQFLPH